MALEVVLSIGKDTFINNYATYLMEVVNDDYNILLSVDSDMEAFNHFARLFGSSAKTFSHHLSFNKIDNRIVISNIKKNFNNIPDIYAKQYNISRIEYAIYR